MTTRKETFPLASPVGKVCTWTTVSFCFSAAAAAPNAVLSAVAPALLAAGTTISVPPARPATKAPSIFRWSIAERAAASSGYCLTFSENCLPTAIGNRESPATPNATSWGFGWWRAPTYDSTKSACTARTTQSAAVSSGSLPSRCPPLSPGFEATATSFSPVGRQVVLPIG